MGSGEGETAVQRWRLLIRRTAGPLTQREHELAWEEALEASGLPCVRSAAGRRAPRMTFAVPLPVGVAGEAEPAEILLTERRRAVEVRTALRSVMPGGTELVDLHDVWLGEPGLPSLVTAADYRIELDPAVPVPALTDPVAALMNATELPRTRGDRRYDLRPLLVGLLVASGGTGLRCRLRHDQALGTGRPDELLAELGERIGAPLPVLAIVRERVILAGDDG